MFGRLILFDGKTGQVLQWLPTPDRKESFYPPHFHTLLDGEQSIVLGTGGITKEGSLFIISMYDFFQQNITKVRNANFPYSYSS